VIVGAAISATTASSGVTIGFYGRNIPSKAGIIGHGVTVKPSNLGSVAGRGLFVTENYLTGDWITEYDGEVIDHATAEARKADPKNRGTHIRTLRHGHSYIDGINVNATAGRGGASFANDSFTVHRAVGHSLYNAKFESPLEYPERSIGVKRTGDVVPERVFLRATTRIAAGSEIYVDYGRDYWDRHEQL
jgi:SET domain-containing protein